MPTASDKKLAQELVALADDAALLAEERGRGVLHAALATRDPRLVAQAAKLVADHAPSGFEAALCAAYRAFAGERAAQDPGCLAKEALVIALDALESLDAELFADAARCEQRERAKGGFRETGARVRARGVLGLARLGHHDILPILGALLADRDATVRLSAARAIAHRGQRDAAGLLLLRLGAGDSEPEIEIECLRALFVVAPDLGLRRARASIDEGDARKREHTLHALGTAPSDAAVSFLAEELASRSLSDERRPVIEALGLSLRPSGREVLIALIGEGSPADSRAALAALSIHRYDVRLVEQLRTLTQASRELARSFRELYEA